MEQNKHFLMWIFAIALIAVVGIGYATSQMSKSPKAMTTLALANLDENTSANDITQLEENVLAVKGVMAAQASTRKGTLRIRHKTSTDFGELKKATRRAGFKIEPSAAQD